MNRNQRRFGRITPKNDGIEEKFKAVKVKNDELEEVLSPRFKRNPFKNEKAVAHRCCYIAPNLKDEEQSVDNYILDYNFDDLIRQQYESDPDTKHFKELRKVLCESKLKVENYSQYINPQPKPSSYLETSDASQWQNVDNTDDLEKLLNAENEANVFIPKKIDINNIYISEVPNIKVIAEKFIKFKRNNVELRKLEEKIVCVEYDIFENNVSVNKDFVMPIQKMRAFFSVKPTTSIDGDKKVTILPSTIKNKFHITDEDLEHLNEKEIEIIDEKIAENKPYLDDLKRVLKRKQAIYAKKKKSSLDLKSLYEMAKREGPSLDEDFSDTNLLSKAELEEIKDLITKQCASSIHGINRHTVKCEKDVEQKEYDNMDVISKSLFAELIRNDPCV